MLKFSVASAKQEYRHYDKKTGPPPVRLWRHTEGAVNTTDNYC